MNQKYLLLLLLLLPQILLGQGGGFIENKGQWDARAQFRMTLPEGYAFLEKSGITYTVFHPEAFPKHPGHADETAVARKSKPDVIGHVLRAHFLNSQSPKPQGIQAHTTKYNFFIGEQSQWASNAQAYDKVHYPSLYANIDLEVYLHYGHLKYDLIVAPGGNPAAIAFRYEGNEGIDIKEGRLRVHTRFNVLEEQVPIAYQYINGQRKEVQANFELKDGVVGFSFPQGYDPAYALVIDPELVFSTYSGSTQDNWGFTATYDAAGNTYTAGLTRGGGKFPTTPGVILRDPISDQNNTVSSDIGILKFSPQGDELLYATYLGGSNTDLPHSLLVNHQNQLIVLGSTGSANFPTTSNAFDATFNGGDGFSSSVRMEYSQGSDIFVTVLNSEGSALIGSTYIGGARNDGIDLTGFSLLTRNYGDSFRGDLQVDEEDNIYLVSTTFSPNFPMIGNTFRRVHNGGQDGVICSLSPTASTMRWSAFLGGSQQDGVFSVRLTSQGHLAVCGGTNSPNFPTAGNPLNPQFGGEIDGFVALIAADGSELIASTFLGTAAYDQAYLLDVDENDNVVVFGQTMGSYPISSSDLFSNPNSGQFLHKLSPNLSTTVFSTVFGSGGSGRGDISVNIRPTAFLVSNCGDIFLSGWGGAILTEHMAASTVGMPTTPDNIPATRETSEGDDFYLMILSADAKELLYGAYMGGISEAGNLDHVDGGTSRFDENGIMYQAVCVCRDNNFPTSAGVFSSNNLADNGCNNLVFKFDLKSISARVNPNVRDEDTGIFIEGSQGCAPLEVLFTPDSVSGNDLRWVFGDGATAQQNSPGNISHVYTEPGVYEVVLQSLDPTTCEKVVEAIGTITVYETAFEISPNVEICEGDSIAIMASGAVFYEWVQGETLTSTNTASTIAFPQETTQYQVFLENEQGCRDTLTTTVAITEGLVQLESSFIEACDTLPRLTIIGDIRPQGVATWQLNGEPIEVGNNGQFEFVPTVEGQYTFIATATNKSCIFRDTLVLDIEYNAIGLAYQQATLEGAGSICQGDTVALSVTEGFIYSWTPIEGLSANNTAAVLANPSQTTEYVVTVSNGQDNCFIERKATIEVFPEILFDLQYGFAYECGDYPRVVFSNASTGASVYEWRWNDIVFDTASVPQPYLPSQSGVQILTVAGSNLKCQSTISFEIDIPEIVLPPNVITPNGDGKNDTFQVNGIEGWAVQIYNRWGKLVYESQAYQNDWEGGSSLGETFYYLLTAADGTRCKGWVQVLGAD